MFVLVLMKHWNVSYYIVLMTQLFPIRSTNADAIFLCQKLSFLPSTLNHSQLTGWIQPYVKAIIFWLTKDQTKLINLSHFSMNLVHFLNESSQIHHFCQGVAQLMLFCYEVGYRITLNVSKQAEVVMFYSQNWIIWQIAIFMVILKTQNECSLRNTT